MSGIRHEWRCAVAVLAVAWTMALNGQQVQAQGFIFALQQNNPDLIMHPLGYNGSASTLNISVGIDPGSAFASQMQISVRNVISTWNGLRATTGNVQFGVIDGSQIDFESVLLHELGHSLGLAHVNLSSESGRTGGDTNYSKTSTGSNGIYDLNAGSDGIIGSADDLRGDDVNFNFFEKGVNNPFTVNAVVDSTTYGTNLADLPAGDSFVANADRDVSALYGIPVTEGVMQQGSFFGEVQRTLAASDVIGIRYGMSGLDELQGTADDYVLNLQFAGLDASADIVIDFDNSQTGFAVSQSSFTSLNSDHWVITDSNIYFNDGFNWFFNDTLAVPEPAAAGYLAGLACLAAGLRRRSRPSV
jgi:hypothetical protein